jgi:hypothetical protein
LRTIQADTGIRGLVSSESLRRSQGR